LSDDTGIHTVDIAEFGGRKVFILLYKAISRFILGYQLALLGDDPGDLLKGGNDRFNLFEFRKVFGINIFVFSAQSPI